MYIYRCTLCQGHGNCVESVLSFQGSVSEAGAKQQDQVLPDVRSSRGLWRPTLYIGPEVGWGQGWPGTRLRPGAGRYQAARSLPGKPVFPGKDERHGAGGPGPFSKRYPIPPPGSSRVLQVRLDLWTHAGRSPYLCASSRTPTVCGGTVGVG